MVVRHGDVGESERLLRLCLSSRLSGDTFAPLQTPAPQILLEKSKLGYSVAERLSCESPTDGPGDTLQRTLMGLLCSLMALHSEKKTSVTRQNTFCSPGNKWHL